MQITFNLPEDLAQQLQIMPDCEVFVRETLQAAMQQRQARKPLSKWAKIARRIEETAGGLGDYSEQFKQDMREVREELVFKDKP